MCLFVLLLHTILSLSFTFANKRIYDPPVVSFYKQIIEWHSIKIYQEKKLFSDLESNIYIDVSKKENLKPLNLIEIGTKAKLMSTNSTFFPDEKQTKFTKDCLKFCVAARKCCHPMLLKIMNCITFYKYPNSILNNNTYSISIISPVSVLVYSIFFNCKIHFCLVEQQRLLIKPIFISFLLRVNFCSHK